MPEMMELLDDWKGWTPLQEARRAPDYVQRLAEVVDMLANAKNMSPHRHEFMIREALTTSDFPYLFGDVLDRQLLANYKAVEPVWKQFVRMSTVPRIAPQVGGYRFGIRGGDQYLAEVGQKGE